MVGFQDSINLVKDSLRSQDYATTSRTAAAREPNMAVDHDQILRDYDAMMREHERRMSGHQRAVKRHKGDKEDERSRSPKRTSSMKFRFKQKTSGTTGSEKKEKKKEKNKTSKRAAGYRGRDYAEDEAVTNDAACSSRLRSHSPQRHRDAATAEPASAGIEAYAAHPLPRPRQHDTLDPTDSAAASASPRRSPNSAPFDNAEASYEGPDDAFRASLFDAIADDEGAAYWQGVYGEPIHLYQRPTVEKDGGVLEHMDDEQYAEYVKRKMWEKKNPELAREREERARRELEAEERRKRSSARNGRRDESRESGESDYEWVGNEEKGYERRRTRAKPRASEGNSKRNSKRNKNVMADVDEALARGARRKEAKRWQQAWSDYQQKWEDLKHSSALLQGADLANAMPWPVITGAANDVSTDAVEDFLLNATPAAGETQLGLLKAERFRWHPDKIQHRFGGDNVDAETLKLVTSVFQTIDELMATERKRSGKD